MSTTAKADALSEANRPGAMPEGQAIRLRRLGSVRPRESRDIAASPLYELPMTRDEEGAWHCDEGVPRGNHPLILTDRCVVDLGA
ncbi:MAG: hypothetical protein ACOC3G_06305 [Phycisphaeraceae bacterium]